MAIVTLNDGENAGTFRGYLNAMFVELFEIFTGKAGGGTLVGSTTTNQDLNLRSNAIDLTTGSVNVLDTLEASDVNTGAMTVGGGLAVKKKLYATNAFLATPTTAAGSVATTNGTQTLSDKLLVARAGTAAAGTAPIKMLSGTLMTDAEAGAMEFLTDKLYFTQTTAAARKEIAFRDSYYGGFYTYNKAATMIIPIDTADVYHAIRSVTAGDILTSAVDGFTFNQGRLVDADIANIKNGAGGKLQIECSGAHALTTGDIVCITKENRVAGNNMVTMITKVDSTQFTCDQIDYAGGTQTSTAVISEPAYLLASAGTSGTFHANISCNFTGTNARVIKMELNVGGTPSDEGSVAITANGTIQAVSSSSNVSIAAGDRIFITCKNVGGVEDITITNGNMNLHRL